MIILDLFWILSNQFLLVGIMQQCAAPRYILWLLHKLDLLSCYRQTILLSLFELELLGSWVMHLIKQKLNINFSWAQVYQGTID